MTLSPVALFVYNRPVHTKKVLNALKKNEISKKTIIYIFSDASKNLKDAKNVQKVRDIIQKCKGFKSKRLYFRKKNLGLAKNFILGITLVCNKHGKIIVLEDDNLTSPYFLKYMNDALNLYKNEKSVASISGYSYPIKNHRKGYYFLRIADSWGWATWIRSWQQFDKNGTKILNALKKKKLISKFNFDNSYDFFRILRNFCLKKNNSWSIRWYGSMFLKNKLTLFPPKSYIQNIGMDNSGVHSDVTDSYKTKLTNDYIKINKISIKESPYHFGKMKLFFKKINKKNNFFSKIFNKFKLFYEF